MKTNDIPLRKDVLENDKWNLSSLYKSNKEWEEDLESFSAKIEKVEQFAGKLSESKETLLNALKALEEADKSLEKIYNYAHLILSTDEACPDAQDKEGRARMAYTNFLSRTSFFNPELQSIDSKKIDEWIEDPSFSDYRIFIKKLLRLKQFILSEKEERIISLQSESAATSHKAFTIFTNADMQFASITIDGKEKALTQSTWSVFMENEDRNIREKAYKQFYDTFEKNENTLAALYAGSVNQDVFYARARSYNSCLEKALYADKIPVGVYHNLIKTINENLDSLHKYYKVRKRVLGLNELRHYDVYVPLVKNIKMHTPYNDAVELCKNALKPLGSEYTEILSEGLLSGWVDRYENKGKRSGAFSGGGYIGWPYILLNYKEDSIRDVFTMIHEGGHSMHSWYSVKNNPYMQYNYTIFEAEVASTFNEELLFNHLLKNAKNNEEKAYLLAMRASDIVATLYRQTMFAEYELKTHELVENGTPLSSKILRETYRSLLEKYFGSEMVFESNSDMEGMRIPHFYNSFYVYKYATGISASLALAKRVTEGGEKEKEDYFSFLKSGGSRYPLESLKLAGVDMETRTPVQEACNIFKSIVTELDKIL
ncbi:MAG: oligoendopeptidase F [Treponema sp.]|nr:oligoendopeptidase F [Treponema sp.]